MFPSPVTSTPFSVKDILNLEQQQQGGLGSMELASLASPSCMLATFKQEAFSAEPPALPDLREELPEQGKTAAAFPGSYYVKSYVEMDTAKEAKADKKGKAERWRSRARGEREGRGLVIPPGVPGAQGTVRGCARGSVRGSIFIPIPSWALRGQGPADPGTETPGLCPCPRGRAETQGDTRGLGFGQKPGDKSDS